LGVTMQRSGRSKGQSKAALKKAKAKASEEGGYSLSRYSPTVKEITQVCGEPLRGRKRQENKRGRDAIAKWTSYFKQANLWRKFRDFCFLACYFRSLSRRILCRGVSTRVPIRTWCPHRRARKEETGIRQQNRNPWSH
jgi:hypothetical protein